MNAEILKTVCQAAGIGGVALVVFYLLFREIIRKSIFPKLPPEDAYRLLRLIIGAIWSVAVIGIAAWAVTQPPPFPPIKPDALLDRMLSLSAKNALLMKQVDDIKSSVDALSQEKMNTLIHLEQERQDNLRRIRGIMRYELYSGFTDEIKQLTDEEQKHPDMKDALRRRITAFNVAIKLLLLEHESAPDLNKCAEIVLKKGFGAIGECNKFSNLKANDWLLSVGKTGKYR
jgi:hypothetical protein